jgi:putative sigma-54 modulation protein
MALSNPNQQDNMQTANVDLHITVTGRHLEVTDAIREYARRKIDGLHLDYPRIIEAKVILDVPAKDRHFAEIILFCANHITIECSSTCDDLYAAIDETISKIARRMRKYKTKLLRNHRPRTHSSIRHLDEHVFAAAGFEDHAHEEIEPFIIHPENYRIRPLYPDEAITALELSENHFVVFHNQKTHELNILFRRKDGDYGMIGLPGPNGNGRA